MRRRATPGAPADRWRVAAALASVYLIWGSGYLAVRVLVEEVPPFLSMAARYAVSGGVLLAALAARSSTRRRALPLRGTFAPLLLTALLMVVAGQGLLALGVQHVPAGLAALLCASVPLWVILLHGTVGREHVDPGVALGIAIGFAGVALLLLPGNRPAEATIAGIAIVLLSAAAWALGTFLSPRLALPRDALTSTGWQMLLGGLVLLGCAAADGELGRLTAPSAKALAVFAYLAASSTFAWAAYLWLLRSVSLTTTATYAYVNPLVAVLLGWALLGERVNAATVVAGGLILGSVVVTIGRASPAPVRFGRRTREG